MKAARNVPAIIRRHAQITTKHTTASQNDLIILEQNIHRRARNDTDRQRLSFFHLSRNIDQRHAAGTFCRSIGIDHHGLRKALVQSSRRRRFQTFAAEKESPQIRKIFLRKIFFQKQQLRQRRRHHHKRHLIVAQLVIKSLQIVADLVRNSDDRSASEQRKINIHHAEIKTKPRHAQHPRAVKSRQLLCLRDPRDKVRQILIGDRHTLALARRTARENNVRVLIFRRINSRLLRIRLHQHFRRKACHTRHIQRRVRQYQLRSCLRQNFLNAFLRHMRIQRNIASPRRHTGQDRYKLHRTLVPIHSNRTISLSAQCLRQRAHPLIAFGIRERVRTILIANLVTATS